MPSPSAWGLPAPARPIWRSPWRSRRSRGKEVSRIILTRPAVEAGEKLGFLPGDLQTKVDPYLRPLYDGLFDLLGAETFQKLTEKQMIEVAPLAYMRGRTLDDAFIILDEAQNTSPEQMKMFLTRMGAGSKVVVNRRRDPDRPAGQEPQRSGGCFAVLRGIDGIAQVYFTEKDVVRHRLVQQIIKAYDRAAARRGQKTERSGPAEAVQPEQDTEN